MPTIRATAGIVDRHANFADGEGEANVAEGGNHAGARVFVVRSHGDVCVGQGVNARSRVIGEGGNKAAKILALACTLEGGFGQCRRFIARAAGLGTGSSKGDEHVLDGDVLRLRCGGCRRRRRKLSQAGQADAKRFFQLHTGEVTIPKGGSNALGHPGIGDLQRGYPALCIPLGALLSARLLPAGLTGGL